MQRWLAAQVNTDSPVGGLICSLPSLASHVVTADNMAACVGRESVPSLVKPNVLRSFSKARMPHRI
jgi:hypothetical protein